MGNFLGRFEEIAVPLLAPDPRLATGRASTEMSLAVPPLKQFTDLGTVITPSRIKTLAIQVSSDITQAGSGQATIRLYAGVDNSGIAGASGASSQIGSYSGPHQYRGAAVNFGASGATIPAGVYFFSPQDIPELQWWYPYVGTEIDFAGGGDPSTGALAAYFYPASS